MGRPHTGGRLAEERHTFRAHRLARKSAVHLRRLIFKRWVAENTSFDTYPESEMKQKHTQTWKRKQIDVLNFWAYPDKPDKRKRIEVPVKRIEVLVNALAGCLHTDMCICVRLHAIIKSSLRRDLSVSKCLGMTKFQK